jgi:hypothetical protein
LYWLAVEEAFLGAVDFAQLVKVYGASPEGEKRYSPAECIGYERIGVPLGLQAHLDELRRRHNLTIRMSMRRYTRLTNAHSKKLRNNTAALGLLLCYYNFCRIHRTIRCTPVVAAGVTSRVWSVEDLVGYCGRPPARSGAVTGNSKLDSAGDWGQHAGPLTYPR